VKKLICIPEALLGHLTPHTVLFSFADSMQHHRCLQCAVSRLSSALGAHAKSITSGLPTCSAQLDEQIRVKWV